MSHACLNAKELRGIRESSPKLLKPTARVVHNEGHCARRSRDVGINCMNKTMRFTRVPVALLGLVGAACGEAANTQTSNQASTAGAHTQDSRGSHADTQGANGTLGSVSDITGLTANFS